MNVINDDFIEIVLYVILFKRKEICIVRIATQQLQEKAPGLCRRKNSDYFRLKAKQ
jgi:hypothetical protein